MKLFTIILGFVLAYSAYPESLDNEIVLTQVTAASVKAQGDVLRQRTAELKLAEIKLPVQIFPTINSARLVRASDDFESLLALSLKLDGYAQELEYLANARGQLGSTKLIIDPFVSVAQKVAVKQIYSVGMPLQVGAGILIAKHWQHDIHLQASNQDSANFITVTTNNPTVIFKNIRIRRKGIHGSRYGLTELPFFEIAEGQLLTGDTITITYGAGSQKFQLPEVASKHITLPIYLRTQTTGVFFEIPVQEFEVAAEQSARLVVLAPSILKVDQVFNLAIRAEDRFGNLASGTTPALEIIVDGVYQQRIQLPANNVMAVDGLRFLSEGRHQITVRSGGGGLVGRSNPILVDNHIGYEINWANLHQHSNQSDAIQSPEEIQLETTGLYDVNLIADHDDYAPEKKSFPLNNIERPEVVSLPLSRGGHHLVIPGNSIPGSPRLVVALPEVPPDHRSLYNPVLVEVHSGSSSHEWLGQYFSSLGYRVGFSASSTSHLPARNLKQGLTAIMIVNDEEVGEAIQARRTYASSGSRSILIMNVNGGLPGSRIPLQDRRKIQGDIYSNAAIDSVELIRNGVVIDRYHPLAEDDSLRIKVTFGSESKPIVPGWDSPRNGREWLGYIRISGAQVTTISAPGYKDRKRSAISLNPAESARVDFITWTHGSESSFVITLGETTGEDVSLQLNIKEGYEDADYMPANRRPSETAAHNQLVTLASIIDGAVEHSIDNNGYDDSVRLELATSRHADKISFSFVDTRKMGINDYYYVKVNQADDHTLWSSPVYVGGFDSE